MLISLWLVFVTQYREGYAQSGASGNRAGETICWPETTTEGRMRAVSFSFYFLFRFALVPY
jgi:hypothetical protein